MTAAVRLPRPGDQVGKDGFTIVLSFLNDDDLTCLLVRSTGTRRYYVGAVTLGMVNWYVGDRTAFGSFETALAEYNRLRFL